MAPRRVQREVLREMTSEMGAGLRVVSMDISAMACDDGSLARYKYSRGRALGRWLAGGPVKSEKTAPPSKRKGKKRIKCTHQRQSRTHSA